MHSMTGFGRAQGSLPQSEIDLTVDIRTVNSRYLDFKAHIPRELLFMELDLKKVVQKHVHRGRVDLFLDIQEKSKDESTLNRPMVEHLLSLTDQLKKIGVGGELMMGDILRLPGVITPASVDWESATVQERVVAVTRQAVRRLAAMREAEGKILKGELEQRISKLKDIHQQLTEGVDKVREYYRTKMKERFAELSPAELHENRFAQEIIYLSERADISEELVRFESHLSAFAECLKGEDAEASIGKRLDFICQELNREATTILSKSALIEVSNAALEAKSEIERIREQVQNVE